ncbi:MAG: hypothetical protein ACRDL7_00005, partial [Gaiellaceae bacterium]
SSPDKSDDCHKDFFGTSNKAQNLRKDSWGNGKLGHVFAQKLGEMRHQFVNYIKVLLSAMMDGEF